MENPGEILQNNIDTREISFEEVLLRATLLERLLIKDEDIESRLDKLNMSVASKHIGSYTLISCPWAIQNTTLKNIEVVEDPDPSSQWSGIFKGIVNFKNLSIGDRLSIPPNSFYSGTTPSLYAKLFMATHEVQSPFSEGTLNANLFLPVCLSSYAMSEKDIHDHIGRYELNRIEYSKDKSKKIENFLASLNSQTDYKNNEIHLDTKVDECMTSNNLDYDTLYNTRLKGDVIFGFTKFKASNMQNKFAKLFNFSFDGRVLGIESFGKEQKPHVIIEASEVKFEGTSTKFVSSTRLIFVPLSPKNLITLSV